MRLTIDGVTRRVSLYKLHGRLSVLGRRFQGKPSGAYLAAVVGFLAELGFPGRSHRMAARLVRAVSGRIDGLRAKGWGLEEARLARVYGAGVLGARPRRIDLLKLAINETAVWAEEKLRDTPRLTPEAVKSLTLLATGSQEAAEDAWADATMAEMREGLSPAT